MAIREVGGLALLIGCPGQSLQGIELDIHDMTAVLQKRGFTVDVCAGPCATRERILAGYNKLIRDVRPGQPAVFYYAGHGFLAYAESQPNRAWQGICPADMAATTDDDFRGITSLELSIKQAQLTAQSDNVTVILDCCYASEMSRFVSFDAVARALPHPIRRGVDAHLDALRALYPDDFGRVGPMGNRSAVRFVACGQNESAYEYCGSNGKYRGVFTEALVNMLNEVGEARVTWAAINASIRGRVAERFSIQHPGIEGPARRVLFSREEGDGGRALPITSTQDQFCLYGGAVMGVTIGDVYAIMPTGATAYRAEAAIAEVVVDRLSGTLAGAAARWWRSGESTLPDGAVAFPIETRAPRYAVPIDVPEAERMTVEEAIASAPTLRVAEREDATVLPRLCLGDAGLVIADPLGPLFPTIRFPDDLVHAVNHLVRLASAQRLRDLDGGHGVSSDELEVEWGIVDRGDLRPMATRSASLAMRDKVYIRVQSKAERPLYIHMLSLDAAGRTALLTGFTHTGALLRCAGADFVLGSAADGAIHGIEPSWPAGVPHDIPRLEEILVIATALPTSLEDLQTIERQALEDDDGASKELPARPGMDEGAQAHGSQLFDGFLVARLAYLLHPRDAAIADPPFLIDDGLGQICGALAPQAWIIPDGNLIRDVVPQTVTIRLTDLMVNTAARLSGDARVDVLVSTREHSGVSYRAWTLHGLSAAQRADLGHDAGVVFHGRANDFIALQLWISPDRRGSLDLAQLLAQRADPSGVPIGGTASVTRAPTLAAAGAAAAVARSAYETLRDAVGTALGVYRICFTAQDAFGNGRHPSVGLHQTPEISFAVSIARGDAGDAGE